MVLKVNLLCSVCFVTVVAGNVPEPPVVDGHFATHSLPVQPGCRHAGGHIVLRPHPPCDGRIGTTNLIVKYPPIVQDPHSWRPSIAFYSRCSLPANRGFVARYESGAKLVGAIGVMFTVAGQDDIRPIYSNISFRYFFEQS